MSKTLCECGVCDRCKQREHARRYRERHPERVAAAKAKYAASHPTAQKEAGKRWREANPDAVKARKKAWRKTDGGRASRAGSARVARRRNQERVARAEAASRSRYPEKVKARQAVRTALRRGELMRQPCEVCGEPDAQAHHDDYSKPLDVRWLCPVHHQAAHKAG